MATRHISVCVGGLWRTDVVIEEEATWGDLIIKIGEATNIQINCQKLTPTGGWCNRCGLEDGDDVFCDWALPCGRHPLHSAAMDENIKAIRLWIASCADINVTNDIGITPLMWAVLNLKDKSVIELLRLGANAKLVNKYGNNALHYVTNNHYFNKDKMKKIVKMLIKAGCDPTTRNNDNETYVDIVERIHGDELVMEVETWIKDAIGEA